MGVVAFDANAFKDRYPEFLAVSANRLGYAFADAQLYLDNSDISPVQNLAVRQSLLWMLTAHIAYLSGYLSAEGQALPVGRVSSAGEGTVNASLDMQTPSSAAWYQQTQYGSMFWQATINLRSMRYVPKRVRY
jgi:hypothetical protein